MAPHPPSPDPARDPVSRARRHRNRAATAVGLSAVVHLGLGLFLWSNRPPPPPLPLPEPIQIELVAPPPPPPLPPPPLSPPLPSPPDPVPDSLPGGAAEASPVEVPASASTSSSPSPARPTPVRPRPVRLSPLADVESVPAAAAALAPFPTVSDADLMGALHAGSGAATGGSGSGSGAGRGDGAGPDCDMIGRLQNALADDARVAQAVARAASEAQGRALLVWNGAWVQAAGQSGRGLAGVRQALAVEIAFAPAACRNQPLTGLAVIRLSGGTRLAMGDAAWRWTDLLEAGR